jgi:hypothetical protein
VAEPLEHLQNNKHEDQFIKSFTLKVFIFKFINTNMSLVYTIYSSSVGNGNAQKDLQVLMVGMMLQKMAQIYGT